MTINIDCDIIIKQNKKKVVVNINSNRYFNIAKESSKLSDYPKIHIGACIIYKKQILAIGFNSLTTHTMQKEYNIYRTTNNRQFNVDHRPNYLHAEMSCLVATKHFKNINWSKAHMYVWRNGMCRPCNGCRQAMIDRGIRHIHYINEYGKYVDEIIG